MTFGFQHYVPILRSKRAEWKALSLLSSRDRAALTPLVELTPGVLKAAKGPAAIKKALKITTDNIVAASQTGRIFLDLGHVSNIYIENRTIWSVITTTLAGSTLVVPVLRLGAPIDVARDARVAVAQFGNGACLRIPGEALRSGTLTGAISSVLQAANLGPENVDLIVDLENDPGAMTHDDMRASIPHINTWRTWTVCSGVFPADLSGFDPSQGLHPIPRRDLLTWRAQLQSRDRKPAFGDYTIQYGLLREVDGRPSASVRYALEDSWLVLRGRRPDKAKGLGWNQYIGHARYLCSTPYYRGASFSAGDLYIQERTVAGSTPGNPGTWLFAGINHHMVLTAQQVQSA